MTPTVLESRGLCSLMSFKVEPVVAARDRIARRNGADLGRSRPIKARSDRRQIENRRRIAVIIR